jgi:hypothetical protein
VAHGFANGTKVYIQSVVGMTEINSRTFVVANTAATTFELQGVDGTSYTAYASGGQVDKILIQVNPYLEGELFDIGHAQSADVMTIVHSNHNPRTLSRTAHDVWVQATKTFAPEIGQVTGLAVNTPGAGNFSYQWVVSAIDDDTGEEGLASSSVSWSARAELSESNQANLTWTAVSGADRYYIYRSDNNGIWGLVGEATTNSFDDENHSADKSTKPTINNTNPFGSSGNYPSAVNYIQQRLAFASTDNDPQTIWMSQIGNYYNMNNADPPGS